MPITCPIQIEALNTEEFKAIDYQIMAHIFASHKKMGWLADENIYQADIATRLEAERFRVAREVQITVSFGTFVKHYFHALAGIKRRCGSFEHEELERSGQIGRAHV